MFSILLKSYINTQLLSFITAKVFHINMVILMRFFASIVSEDLIKNYVGYDPLKLENANGCTKNFSCCQFEEDPSAQRRKSHSILLSYKNISLHIQIQTQILIIHCKVCNFGHSLIWA